MSPDSSASSTETRRDGGQQGTDGALNSVVPGVAVLLALGIGFGAVAVTLLSRATSSDVQ